MPRIKSAKKRVLVAERNRQRNVAYKSAIRTAIRKVYDSLQGKPDVVAEKLKEVYSLIDRAILKGILHKNTGSRYKSRLTKATVKPA